MNHKPTPKFLFLLAATASCWVAPGALAQTPDTDDELEMIELDRPGGDEDVPEEVYDDMVFDEDTQTYRLIEDDEGDDWVEPPEQSELDAEELKRLYVLYREAMNNGELTEADTLAKRVVELSIRLNGLDSHDSARAITNLGIAQHMNKDYESAMLNFSSSIGIIERVDDRLSAALINPLQGLAASQAAAGRPDLARQTYQRAVHVSHVNEGPHNPDQVETLESLAELNISMGDVDVASDIQENIYSIQARNIDPMSLDILPALENKASWEHRLQRYQSERLTWRQVINVIEHHKGKDSLELIRPLTNLGKSYLFVSPAEYDYQTDVSSSSGETYLRRANRIADNNPDATWKIVEDTLLSLGDYFILSGRPNRASKVYEEAWELLSEENNPERLQYRWAHLEQVNVLQKVYPPKYYNSERTDNGQEPPDNFETGSMTFSFAVAPNGRVTNIENLEVEPAELEEFSDVVGRSLRRLMYRPRSADGDLVPTQDIIYTHEFFYRPSDLPSNKPAPEGAEQ